MEKEKTNVDHLIEHVEDYLGTREDLGRLVIAEKTSSVLSSVFANLIIVIAFLLVIVFASIALAVGISAYFDSAFAGFLAVAVLYLILGVVLYNKQDEWLKSPVENALIKNILKDFPDEKN